MRSWQHYEETIAFADIGEDVKLYASRTSMSSKAPELYASMPRGTYDE